MEPESSLPYSQARRDGGPELLVLYVVARLARGNRIPSIFKIWFQNLPAYFSEFILSGKKIVPNMLLVLTVYRTQISMSCNGTLPYRLFEIICRTLSVILRFTWTLN